ncbi:MAG: hypothetical protein K5886_10020 [Lachnospiraceae bacterium]|nr:hypothetical protein [Lachnospiraceae bacterium]
MKKKALRSVIAALICLTLLCDSQIHTSMAETVDLIDADILREADINDTVMQENADEPETAVPKEDVADTYIPENTDVSETATSKDDITDMIISENADISETAASEEDVLTEEMPDEDDALEMIIPEEAGVLEESPSEIVESIEKDETEDELMGSSYVPYDGAKYSLIYEELNNGSIKITGFNGSARGELVIPNRISGKPVSVIGTYAFAKFPILRIYTASNTVSREKAENTI